ncbi:SurA N-terminal domain-containing protein [Ornithinimicrobium pekingense]|uniref:peptidylprolyl isomerase n=1 Tax=Ornithinimicrobium pekingense TaxID=384677 RepID=A0ABQ2FET4_9MICO|nr:SurA N-terminal domain-containing protein [Ornithinimicrobium pekingense]GGK82784.1 hypothetical protein GCM10011509_34170 [Ornithinimicrobium pekingense]
MRRTLLTTTGTDRRTSGAVSALTLAGALVLGACSTEDAGPDAGGTSTSTSDAASSTAGDEAAATGAAGEDAAGATVDVEALPDPVAEVNGEPIAKAEFVEVFEQQRDAAQQTPEGGAAMAEVALRDAVLDSLVSNALIAQEGERLGLEADEEQVDAEIASIAEQSGIGSSEEFLTLLAEQGVDEEQVREEAARLVVIDGVVAERGDVEPPTDEEVRAYYDELAGGEGAAAAEDAGLPAFEDIEEMLAEQLAQERENEAITAILADLEAEAEITRHL